MLMAASSGRSSWKVLVALFVCVSLCLIASVSGDAALINDVCSKSNNPVPCNKCFKFYEVRSSKEDVKALGRTSIACAHDEYDILRATIDMYVADAKVKEGGFKNALRFCKTKLVSLNQQINAAVQSWQQGRYATSSNQMSAARRIVNDCGNELFKFLLPKEMTDQLVALVDFCEASIGVLNQIH